MIQDILPSTIHDFKQTESKPSQPDRFRAIANHNIRATFVLILVVVTSLLFYVSHFFIDEQQQLSNLNLLLYSSRTASCTFLETATYSPFFAYDLFNSVLHFDKNSKEDYFSLSSKEYFQKYYLGIRYNPANEPFLKYINGGSGKFSNKKIYNIHSHNDYWRPHPLFDALERNFKSVEADIWYLPSRLLQAQCLNNRLDLNNNISDTTPIEIPPNYKQAELYVGHQRHLLSKYRTISSLYINFLKELLDNINTKPGSFNETRGVYYNFPEESLNFIIDIKTKDSYLAYKLLLQKLNPIQQYLSFYDFAERKFVEKQVTIILSGNIPLKEILAQDDVYATLNQGKRYIFVDVDIIEEAEKLDKTEDRAFKEQQLSQISVLASTSYDKLLLKSRTNFYNIEGVNHNVIDSDNLYSGGLLSKGQLKYLNHSSYSIKNINLQQAKNDTIKTRIWGIPEFHYSHRFSRSTSRGNYSSFLQKASIYYKYFVEKAVYVISGGISTDKEAQKVDANLWKDLVINGGISMINIDDLDFGMRVYDEIMDITNQ